MGKNLRIGNTVFSRLRSKKSRLFAANNKGQALVEFTLCFLLLLVIAWIPADFGLAFYSSQLAGNAAREGARIGSASNPFNASDIATETCRRLPSALLSDPANGWTSCSPVSNARVLVESVAGTGTCNQMIRVSVAGNYNFFFYQLLKAMGASVSNSKQITAQASMRWEHQDC